MTGLKNTDLSLGIKKTPQVLLDISIYLLNIDQMLTNKKIVILEGEQESGKTTICSEICFGKNDNCFSVFFNKYNIAVPLKSEIVL